MERTTRLLLYLRSYQEYQVGFCSSGTMLRNNTCHKLQWLLTKQTLSYDDEGG